MVENLQSLYFLIDAKRKVKVPLQDIMLLHGQKNYTHFFCKNRKRHLMARTLKFFEKELTNQGFYRVHRSCIINIGYVKDINLATDTIILSNNTTIKMSRRKRKAFLEAFMA